MKAQIRENKFIGMYGQPVANNNQDCFSQKSFFQFIQRFRQLSLRLNYGSFLLKMGLNQTKGRYDNTEMNGTKTVWRQFLASSIYNEIDLLNGEVDSRYYKKTYTRVE